ncbi:MAG: retroviral-like aspartic protease family protein [Pseudomonadota bacterium]
MRCLVGVLLAAGVSANAWSIDLPLTATSGGALYIGASQSDSSGFLVDTGSSYVVVTAAMFKEIRESTQVTYLRHIRGAFADGRQAGVPIYRVKRLLVSPECELADVEVAMIMGASRNILGMSGLARLQPFTVAIQPPILTTRGCQ